MTQTEVIETIANLNNEQQGEFYAGLEAQGFTTNEIQSIQGVVFAHKLYNDTYLYKTICNAMCEAYLEEVIA